MADKPLRDRTETIIPKIWASKYALSQGIFEIGPVKYRDNMVSFRQQNGMMQFYHGLGKEFHFSLEEAQARAEEMRIAKIASLHKQIEKLQKMKIEARIRRRWRGWRARCPSCGWPGCAGEGACGRDSSR